MKYPGNDDHGAQVLPTTLGFLETLDFFFLDMFTVLTKGPGFDGWFLSVAFTG